MLTYIPCTIRGPATSDAVTGPATTTTTDISPLSLTHPAPLGITPPSHPSVSITDDISDHHHGRRFTSIVDSLPKEIKPLSPHSVLKRNMLVSGIDMQLHSAFRNEKNLPFPFFSGHNLSLNSSIYLFYLLLSYAISTYFSVSQPTQLHPRVEPHPTTKTTAVSLFLPPASVIITPPTTTITTFTVLITITIIIRIVRVC